MTDASKLPNDWQAVLGDEFKKPYWAELMSFVAEERKNHEVFPPEDEVFSAFHATPFNDVKVVILGQDPYHGPGQAHGLSFSVQKGVRVPPSLVNIYKELHADLGLPIPDHGNLTHWAEQGVLLLNASLTVEDGQPASHSKLGWEVITDAVVAAVAAKPEPCVFLLWGSHARRKAERVPGLIGGHHLVLTAPHPSPLSAHSGWFGCRHFSKANAFLEAKGRGAVDWQV